MAWVVGVPLTVTLGKIAGDIGKAQFPRGPEATLANEIENINRALPVVVSDANRLDRIELADHQVIANYTFLGDASRVSQRAVEAFVWNSVRPSACKDPFVMRVFAANLPVSYRYFDTTGRLLGGATLYPSHCSAAVKAKAGQATDAATDAAAAAAEASIEATVAAATDAASAAGEAAAAATRSTAATGRSTNSTASKIVAVDVQTRVPSTPYANVLFDVGDVQSLKGGEDSLQSVIEYLMANPSDKARISVNYDPMDANARLHREAAVKRAKAVEDSMLMAGLPRSQIQVQKPVKNSNGSGSYESQWVEVVIVR